MEKDVSETLKEMAQRYVASQRHTIQVDYLTYSDMLADLIGCKPRFWPLFFRDPKVNLHFWVHLLD